MKTKNLTDQIQNLLEEAAANGEADDNIKKRIQKLIDRHHNLPQKKFDGLSSAQMHHLIYTPFEEPCIVTLNDLTTDQYDRIPLIRQALFLLKTLSDKGLKLTQLGWLPLKIVSETYALGMPEYLIEVGIIKRINEYDARSVEMARAMLEVSGWIKIRKGILSLTAKGKKALQNIDVAANTLLLCALKGGIISKLDGYEDSRIGNYGIPYSVWLLDKYGEEWHTADFYHEKYQQVFNFQDSCHIYGTRVFERLFYWLGIVEQKKETTRLFSGEFMKTELLQMMFSIKK